MADQEIIVRCPKCTSDEIREKNTAYADVPVVEWEWDAKDGVPQPADYDLPFSADWEVSDVRYQYVCHGCAWEGNIDDLVVEFVPSTPSSPGSEP